MAEAVASARPRSRSLHSTSAPSPAKRLVIAVPIPPPAPVTSATLPCNLMICSLSEAVGPATEPSLPAFAGDDCCGTSPSRWHALPALSTAVRSFRADAAPAEPQTSPAGARPAAPRQALTRRKQARGLLLRQGGRCHLDQLPLCAHSQ